MSTQSANFADTVTTSEAVHAAIPSDSAAAFADTVTTSEAVHGTTSNDNVANFADTVDLSGDTVTTVRTTFAAYTDAVALSDAIVAALGPPQSTSDEPFYMGVVGVDSVEPFNIAQADVGVDSVEPFDLLGDVAVDSVEPFDLGSNIGVDSVEPFMILGPNTGGMFGDDPASPRLGWWDR